MDANKKWMSRGKVGCTFASLFAKKPESVNWVTLQIKSMGQPLDIPKGAFILSLQFPQDWRWPQVRSWAVDSGFYTEDVDEEFIGLRYRVDNLIAWVQYFGKDSHVVTRQAPIPELMMCVKLPSHYYFRVGFTGILHLAHATVRGLKSKIADKLWETSYKNTEKILGHKPTKHEAAKVTYRRNG